MIINEDAEGVVCTRLVFLGSTARSNKLVVWLPLSPYLLEAEGGGKRIQASRIPMI
jgi:hypothetical protein